jgi:hypothetical protein
MLRMTVSATRLLLRYAVKYCKLLVQMNSYLFETCQEQSTRNKFLRKVCILLVLLTYTLHTLNITTLGMLYRNNGIVHSLQECSKYCPVLRNELNFTNAHKQSATKRSGPVRTNNKAGQSQCPQLRLCKHQERAASRDSTRN